MNQEVKGRSPSGPGCQPSASAASADAPASSQGGIPNAKVWRVTSYMPSHKQFSLSPDLTPEQITKLTGAQSKGKSKDGKCKYQWEFFASRYFDRTNAEWVEIALPCAIWDYYDARWSAYGPPEAFREIGLLPPASGIEGEAGDPQGLHPEGESPVGAEGDETPTPSHPGERA